MSEPAETDGSDIRPVVATSSPSNLGLWAFVVILALGGAWFFSMLYKGDEARVPVTAFDPEMQSSRISAPPPLVLPQDEGWRLAENIRQRPPPLAREPTIPAAAPPAARPAPAIARVAVEQAPDARPIVLEQMPTRPSIVFEQERPSIREDGQQTGSPQERVTATRLANPATTVPQGTVVPAVLETAFDSTRPGAVRALVQRDIFGFDGTRILIPRGSRLYGTYEAGINPGENRALINWTRLLRPDGVTINLNSPASDPLGRAGVEGDVNSRFFARFGSAILQSVLDIGVGLATREATDGVIVALPGSTQNVSQAAQTGQQARPVLKIDHGTSVSVFVARDLDFSTVES